MAGFSESVEYAALSWLEALGYLSRAGTTHRRRCSRYRTTGHHRMPHGLLATRVSTDRARVVCGG